MICYGYFFSEQECAGYEADDDTAATYHRDDRNHGVGVAEGVEIYEVGTNEKQGDEKIEGFQTKGVVCLRLGYHNTKRITVIIAI